MTCPRFASFRHHGKGHYGAITENGVVELSARLPHWPTLRDAIAAQGLPTLSEAATRYPPTIDLGEITFDIPIVAPEKIVCVGVNFPDRNEEYKDGQTAPPNPSLFVRFARSFVGHLSPIVRPPESPQLDYEGEIVVIIGKGGRRIAERDALNHIAAISLCNEGTIRDWVRHAKFNVTQGKNFDKSGSLGPWIVPYRNEAQIADIRLTTKVNGELRQSDRTSRMLFGFRKLISYISTFTTLAPGDVVITGTPTGAGARLDPPRWLEPGDVIEVEASGIGTLRNSVMDDLS